MIELVTNKRTGHPGADSPWESARGKSGLAGNPAPTSAIEPMPSHDSVQAADLAVRLSDGCAALDVALTAETQAMLLRYIGLIARWNKVHNLTAVRDPVEMISHHLLDSLAVIRPLIRRTGVPASLVDIGTGAGLPGLVLAIVWPETKVHLVEPANKKAAFLRQAVLELGLTNVTVLAERVQSLTSKSFGAAPDLLICRAYTRLADFIDQCQPLVDADTVIAAMKGPRVMQEILEFEQRFSHVNRGETNGKTEKTSPIRAAISNKFQFSVETTEELSVPGLDAQRYLVVLSAVACDLGASPTCA